MSLLLLMLSWLVFLASLSVLLLLALNRKALCLSLPELLVVSIPNILSFIFAVFVLITKIL